MRLDRGRPEIRSKSYSNRLLIDFFDPNLPVRSIVATISIQIRIQIYQKILIWSKIHRIWSKICRIWSKTTIFDQIRPFSIKFDNFRLNNWHWIDLNRLKDQIYIEKDRYQSIYIKNRSILYRNRDRRLELNL